MSVKRLPNHAALDTPPGKPNQLIILLACGFFAVVLLMFFSGSGRAQQERPPIVQQDVTVIEVEYQDQYQQVYRAMGRVESTQQASVGFERAGRVAEVLVDDGSSVKAGTVLAKLDTQRIDAQLEEVQAAYDVAKATLTLAENTEKRVVDLVSRGLDSAQRLDEVVENKNIAAARLSQISAQLNSLKVEFEKSLIIATADVDVIERLVDPGAVVSVGQPVLELANNASLNARIPVPPEVASTMNVGEDYVLSVGNQRLNGRLFSLGSQRNSRTRTVDTLFVIPDSPNILAGDLIGAELNVNLPQRGFWIPTSALATGIRGMWTVYVVNTLGQTQIQTRAVEILYSDGNRAFVTGAVNNDELMVLDGTHRFVPKQKVFASKSDLNRSAL